MESKLFDLVISVRYREEHWDDFLEQAAYLHHEAVQIHPFENGNGRWSRILANIWLKQHDHPITLWPSDADVDSPIRKEYHKALQAADEGDKEPLVQLHRRFTDQ